MPAAERHRGPARASPYRAVNGGPSPHCMRTGTRDTGTRFRIGSITKLLVADQVMGSVRSGLIPRSAAAA